MPEEIDIKEINKNIEIAFRMDPQDDPIDPVENSDLILHALSRLFQDLDLRRCLALMQKRDFEKLSLRSTDMLQVMYHRGRIMALRELVLKAKKAYTEEAKKKGREIKSNK